MGDIAKNANACRGGGRACAIAGKRGACALERWCLSRGMSPAQGAAFSADWRANRYGRDNILFYQGNEPFALFFLCSGRVKIVRADDAGRRQIVRIIRAPDFIGERSLIARQPYHATAEVMDDADICVIDASRFFKFWGERVEIARAFAEHLAVSLGGVQDLASDLALHPIRERLAKYLALEWEAASQAASKSAAAFELAESRQELAEIIGTSPEVVSRTLKDLVDGKIIALEGRRVRVLDAARLRSAARLPRETAGGGPGGAVAGGPALDFYQARSRQPSSRLKLRTTHNRQANA